MCLDKDEKTDRKHHELCVCQCRSITFSSQQMAGYSWIICMLQQDHTHTQSHTHTQQGPAEYIASLQRTEGFPALL